MLSLNSWLIKEHVGLLKLVDEYDILDPASGRKVGLARETPSFLAKWLRLLIKKHLLPTVVSIFKEENSPAIFSIHRPVKFFRSKVYVRDNTGNPIGYFKSKLFSLGGGFYLYSNQNNQLAEVKGDWKGWNFKFIGQNNKELGMVTKKWAGIGKELFTSADNYIVSVNEEVNKEPAIKILLLAAALAIDVVYKEN